jgi:glycosyltransferase involved in cell wall biosynthesis
MFHPQTEIAAEGIAVVIPARNEERTIASVVTAVRAALPASRIVVVDDASADATGEAGHEAGAEVLRLDDWSGYAGALRHGYWAALDRGAGIIAQLDGDGQHEPADLPRIIENLAHADVVVGSRFLDDGGYRPTTLRRAGIAGCRWLTARAGGPDLSDPTSGYRALRRWVAEDIAEAGFPRGLTESSLLIRLARRGVRMTEVPVRMYPSDGVSMHDGLAGGAHALRIGWDMAGLVARPGAH